MAENGVLVWSGGEIGAGGMEITSPEGEVIPIGESQEFTFEAKTPETPGAYAWPTSQTYKDGSVVEWAGPADSEESAPFVTVAAGGPEATTPEGAGHHGPDEGAGDHEHAAGGQQNAAASTGAGPVSAYVIVGIRVVVACTATAGLILLRSRGQASPTGRRPRP